MDVWKLWWATLFFKTNPKARSLSQSILDSKPCASRSQPTFFLVFSFLRVFCSIRRYRMKSNTFLPIWSVVTSENNTSIRHFRWESCWSPLSQEKSWNDVTNRSRPRPNLIVFHSVMFQMGAFFAYFENSQKIEVSTKWRNFCGILLSAIFNNYSSSPNGLLTQGPWGREE